MVFRAKKLRREQITRLILETQQINSKLQSSDPTGNDSRHDLSRMRLMLQHYELQLSAHRLIQADEILINNMMIAIISLSRGLISGAIGLSPLLAIANSHK